MHSVKFSVVFYTNNLKQIIGLTLNIPIFNQFQYRTNITSAKITYRNNELNLEMQKFNVYAQVQTAYNNFLTYKEKYNASLAGYIASKLAFEKQLERFKLGIGNIVEFSLASQNFLQAQSVKVQSEYALLFQKIIMDYYTGTLNNIAISY